MTQIIFAFLFFQLSPLSVNAATEMNPEMNTEMSTDELNETLASILETTPKTTPQSKKKDSPIETGISFKPLSNGNEKALDLELSLYKDEDGGALHVKAECGTGSYNTQVDLNNKDSVKKIDYRTFKVGITSEAPLNEDLKFPLFLKSEIMISKMNALITHENSNEEMIQKKTHPLVRLGFVTKIKAIQLGFMFEKNFKNELISTHSILFRMGIAF